MTLIISLCGLCGGAVAASVEICYACNTAGARFAATASQSSSTVNFTGAVLTVRDFGVLERFARLQLPPDDPDARALFGMLDDSRIVGVDAVGPDVATLGSRIVFAVNGGQPEARVLVLPTRHAAAGWTLAVTASRGLALLGRAAGSVVAAKRRDGSAERLHLLDVLQQPQAVEAANAMHNAGGHLRSPTAAVGGAEAVGIGSICPSAQRPAFFRSLAWTKPMAPQRPKSSSIGGQ